MHRGGLRTPVVTACQARAGWPRGAPRTAERGGAAKTPPLAESSAWKMSQKKPGFFNSLDGFFVFWFHRVLGYFSVLSDEVHFFLIKKTRMSKSFYKEFDQKIQNRFPHDLLFAIFATTYNPIMTSAIAHLLFVAFC
jgi:hypothetical protein